MGEPIKAPSSQSPASGNKPDPRWPTGMALLTSLLCPSTTAKRTVQASLLAAWLVHLTAALAAAALVLTLIAWSDRFEGSQVELLLAIPLELLLELLHDLNNEFQRHPWIVAGTTAAVIFSIEIGWLVLAALLMPWGARDEPLRASYRNALRQTWLQTASLIPIILLIGMLTIGTDAVRDAWVAANPPPSRDRTIQYPSWPTMAPTNPTYAKTMADYQAAVNEYNKKIRPYRDQHRKWYDRQPWYVQNPEMIPVIVGFAAALWLLAILLRAVGAARPVPAIDRPPLCEWCGYNLTTIPLESRCPECGEPVVASLGPDARPGALPSWRDGGRIRAWRRCLFTAMRDPARLGRQVRLVLPERDHRWCLALSLPVFFAIGALGLVSGIVVDDGLDGLQRDPAEAVVVATVFGIACVIGAVGVTHIGALVVGWPSSIRHQRNLLVGSIQVASYLNGFLVVWTLVGAAVSVGLIALAEEEYWLGGLAELTGVQTDLISMALWTLPNFAFGIYYLVLVARGTAATRYANR